MFKSRKRKHQEILERQKNVKEEYFDFDRIALFFNHENHEKEHQVIDDRTLKDLDYKELFISLDRTSSSIGQQYLYSKLRVIPLQASQSQIYDDYIKHLTENKEQKEEAIIQLSKLNNQGAYFLQRLFFGESIQKPKWFWLIQGLSISLVASLLISILFPAVLLLALLFASVNTLIHFWNKNNVLGYSNSIPQLLVLHRVAAMLHKKGVFLKSQNEVSQSLQALNKIKRSAIFFKWESTASGEIAQAFDYALDLIKGAFLIEPIIFFRLLGQIESNKKDIKTIFESVGELDIAISLSTWRESLPYYCIPEYVDAVKIWNSESLYHPLIKTPVSNNLEIASQKSILLTGSNMSGKTTFIRTVGINTLLSQTLNTACAKQLTLSRFKIYSAIQIADDLLDNTSYYYEEVKTFKKLTKHSQSEHFNLFLLDEIFKGTNTIERIASGKAVLSYLNGSTNLVFCSTHDLELIDYLQKEYAYFHFEESIEGGQLIFDYQLKKGSLKNTNAIRILEMNNFPSQITEEAKSLAGDLFKIKSMTSAKNL